MRDLAGKNIVITGGAAGIGRQMAIAFAGEKANVAILDINEKMLDETVDQLQRRGVEIKGYGCDVSVPQKVEQVAMQVLTDFKAVDVLVNNAGIVVGKPAADISYDELRHVVDVNLLSVMWTTRQFIGDMMQRNQGHIVNIASATGLLAVPRLSAYCATKFAVVGYSDALRMEMKKFGCPGVNVSCICPSVIDTGMFTGFTPPLLSPMLMPREVARQVIRAVKREKDYLRIPFMVKMIPFFKLLPASWVDRLMSFIGADRAMDHFVGH